MLLGVMSAFVFAWLVFPAAALGGSFMWALSERGGKNEWQGSRVRLFLFVGCVILLMWVDVFGLGHIPPNRFWRE